MTTPDVRCTCTGTCHPENITRQIADVREGIASGDLHGAQLALSMLEDDYTARVLAATDHIGRGTRDA